jgi:hypothetical protein
MVSQQLIAHNTELISATSWKGYQREGRGVVLIDGETVDNPESGGAPLIYVSEKETQETGEGWSSENVADLVKLYNPDSEVIVLVKWRGQLGIYRFKPPISPPAAYEGLKQALP